MSNKPSGTQSASGEPSGHAALAVRLNARRGHITAQTSDVARGFVQGNLAVLPKTLAGDFLAFCLKNPKPCPIIGMSEPSDPSILALGLDLDIRTDSIKPGAD